MVLVILKQRSLNKDDLIKIQRLFVLMVDSRAKPGYNISRYSFHNNSEYLLGNAILNSETLGDSISNIEVHSHLIERIFLHISQKNGYELSKINFQNFLDF